mmetsp:Transcript_27741/g.89309  ORF Transcript_27741/g.89309 Transcript_27741/m.89309 type:complete len:115 (+) Transcript_27741:437-781(+)
MVAARQGMDLGQEQQRQWKSVLDAVGACQATTPDGERCRVLELLRLRLRLWLQPGMLATPARLGACAFLADQPQSTRPSRESWLPLLQPRKGLSVLLIGACLQRVPGQGPEQRK